MIEPSDSDSNTSAHYKSTIASSNQNLPFFDDLKFSHSLHNSRSQSSILENSDFEVPLDHLSNVQKNIEVITLDGDSPKASSSKYHQSIIDLTEDDYKKSSVIPKCDLLSDQKKKITGKDYQYLRMEKIKLEESEIRFIKNINNLKVSINDKYFLNTYILISLN